MNLDLMPGTKLYRTYELAPQMANPQLNIACGHMFKVIDLDAHCGSLSVIDCPNASVAANSDHGSDQSSVMATGERLIVPHSYLTSEFFAVI